jgi:uncharacterized protein (DUF362 family)
MNRREFIKSAAVAGVGVAVLPGILLEKAWAASEGTLVVLVKGTSPRKLARESVKALGGMSSFVKKGDTVVVKPNIGLDRGPEYAANTHPSWLRRSLMCLGRRGSKVRALDRTATTPAAIQTAASRLARIHKDPRMR